MALQSPQGYRSPLPDGRLGAMSWIRRHRGALPLALLLLTLCALLALGASMLQSAPAVTPRQDLSPRDVARALQLARVHDPRRAIPGIVRHLRLSGHEAELLLNHAAERWRPSRWQLTVTAGQTRVRGSVEVEWAGLSRWLNVDLTLRETPALPVIETARVGRLPLPPALVAWALEQASTVHPSGGLATLAAMTIQRVQMRHGQLDLAYAWGADAPARMLAALLPVQEHQRLRAYAAELAKIAASLDPGQPVSLSQVLPPMFELARRRTAEGGAAALENRAALMVLGMVANGIGLSVLLPERAAELDRRPITLTLGGRRDFPQHFLVSATLAAENGASAADTIGLFKELADARRGSGFSFNDIAANRAGTRLGALAVQSPDKLQARLITGLAEQDFMPDVTDLPEFMAEPEFRHRFGGPGSPEYERMVADIERRLGSTALFR